MPSFHVDRAQTPPRQLDAYTIVRAMNPNPKPGIPLQPAVLPGSSHGSPESSVVASMAASRKSSLSGAVSYDISSHIGELPVVQPFSPLRPIVTVGLPSPATLISSPLKESPSSSPLSPDSQLRKKRLGSSRFSSDGAARVNGALPALQTFYNEDGSTYTDRLSPAPSFNLQLQPSPRTSMSGRSSAQTRLKLGTLNTKGLSIVRPPTPIDLELKASSYTLDLGLKSSQDDSQLHSSSSSLSVRSRFVSMSGFPRAGRRSQDHYGFNAALISEALLPVSSLTLLSASEESMPSLSPSLPLLPQERRSTPSLMPNQTSPAVLPTSPASTRAPPLGSIGGNDSLSSFMSDKLSPAKNI